MARWSSPRLPGPPAAAIGAEHRPQTWCLHTSDALSGFRPQGEAGLLHGQDTTRSVKQRRGVAGGELASISAPSSMTASTNTALPFLTCRG